MFLKVVAYVTKAIYTLPLKSLGSVRFFMFFKEVSSAHQGCSYLIKNTEKNLFCEEITAK